MRPWDSERLKPVRLEAIDPYYDSADRTLMAEYENFNPRRHEKISGVELVSDDPGLLEDEYRCAAYAFGTIKGDRWAIDEDQAGITPLRYMLTKFLEESGYSISVDPAPSDVVLYGWPRTRKESEEPLLPYHYGIYMGSRRVTSKFGRHFVWEHGISQVPATYGTHVLFARHPDNQ